MKTICSLQSLMLTRARWRVRVVAGGSPLLAASIGDAEARGVEVSRDAKLADRVLLGTLGLIEGVAALARFRERAASFEDAAEVPADRRRRHHQWSDLGERG